MDQNVLYHGQRLTLTRFWATGEPCLWITAPEQIGMPKMEFVGGHPDEYYIFQKKSNYKIYIFTYLYNIIEANIHDFLCIFNF